MQIDNHPKCLNYEVCEFWVSRNNQGELRVCTWYNIINYEYRFKILEEMSYKYQFEKLHDGEEQNQSESEIIRTEVNLGIINKYFNNQMQ